MPQASVVNLKQSQCETVRYILSGFSNGAVVITTLRQIVSAMARPGVDAKFIKELQDKLEGVRQYMDALPEPGECTWDSIT